MSFDLKLEDKYRCKIVLIDPTLRAIKHYEEVKQMFKTKTIALSGNIQNDYLKNIIGLNPNFDNFTYIDKGLYREKTRLKFYKQTNPNYVSQSLVSNMFGNDYDEVEVDSIKNNKEYIEELKKKIVTECIFALVYVEIIYYK